MYWKTWIKTMCPKDWTNEEVLEFVNLECSSVTLSDVIRERV